MGFTMNRCHRPWPITGLTSRIGVALRASRLRTCTRVSAIARTWTTCRPIGLGGSGARVANTPARDRVASPRGWTVSVSRSARSSQVSRRTSVPGASPFRAGVYRSSKTSQASGAPHRAAGVPPVVTGHRGPLPGGLGAVITTGSASGSLSSRPTKPKSAMVSRWAARRWAVSLPWRQAVISEARPGRAAEIHSSRPQSSSPRNRDLRRHEARHWRHVPPRARPAPERARWKEVPESCYAVACGVSDSGWNCSTRSRLVYMFQ